MPQVILKNQFMAADEVATAEVIKAGIVSGVIGGLAMAAYAMVAGVVLGQGAFAVPQLIGAVFRGPEALLQPPSATLIGIGVHVLTAAAFGVLFATLVRRDTPAPVAMLAGVAYALGVFVLMVFVVVPIVNPVMANRVSMMVGTVLMMHVIYGLGLGLAPRLRKAFHTKRAESLVPTRVTLTAR